MLTNHREESEESLAKAAKAAGYIRKRYWVHRAEVQATLAVADAIDRLLGYLEDGGPVSVREAGRRLSDVI